MLKRVNKWQFRIDLCKIFSDVFALCVGLELIIYLVLDDLKRYHLFLSK